MADRDVLPMLLMTIADFVTAEEVATLRDALAHHPSVDGRLTAQGDARRAKRNRPVAKMRGFPKAARRDSRWKGVGGPFQSLLQNRPLRP